MILGRSGPWSAKFRLAGGSRRVPKVGRCSDPKVAGFGDANEARREMADKVIDKADTIVIWRITRVLVDHATGSGKTKSMIECLDGFCSVHHRPHRGAKLPGQKETETFPGNMTDQPEIRIRRREWSRRSW